MPIQNCWVPRAAITRCELCVACGEGRWYTTCCQWHEKKEARAAWLRPKAYWFVYLKSWLNGNHLLLRVAVGHGGCDYLHVPLRHILTPGIRPYARNQWSSPVDVGSHTIALHFKNRRHDKEQRPSYNSSDSSPLCVINGADRHNTTQNTHDVLACLRHQFAIALPQAHLTVVGVVRVTNLLREKLRAQWQAIHPTRW